jgi:proline-specific peptidase
MTTYVVTRREVHSRKGFLLLARFLFVSILTCIDLACFSSGTSLAGCPGKRESALERKIHIEPKLVTDIPAVGRWCDRLKLSKKRVDVGGCGLYVEEEGRGTPIVLINGGPGGTHHYFHPWFSRAKGYAHVIYYDQRGCGLSDWNSGPGYSVDQAVADLDGLRKALGIDRWVLMGYSYGGFLAQYYTIRHPENVAGLVLVSAMPGMRVTMKPSREMDCLLKEEISRLKAVRKEVDDLLQANAVTKERSLEILLYNYSLNGAWKRQDFFRPSPERAAQMALYEWKNAEGFNDAVSKSVNKVDLAGAFDNCPIPTLIAEGNWDLTWNTDKPGLILANHPGARLVMFRCSGHNIYEDEPRKFFNVLRGFLEHRPSVSPGQLARYKEYLSDWMEKGFQTP